MRGTPLRGARVLVTGASAGIGAATAALCASQGAHVLWAGRDAHRLAELVTGDGERLVADLAAPQGPEELASAAGRVDVLIANAGIGWEGDLSTMDQTTADELITVNLRAPIALTRALLPAMYARGRGHIVLVSSIAALGVREEAVYSATKAGLRVFGTSLRQESAGRGVGVSVLFPGVVRTEFFSRRGQPYRRSRPRPIAPERVAAAIVRATTRGIPELSVPGWLGVPLRVQGAAPGWYRSLAGRFG